MSLNKNKIRAEFDSAKGTWVFIDPSNPKFRIPFDSAIVDVVRSGPSMVEGYVLSVHGVPIDIAAHLSIEGCRAIGINGVHNLARTTSRRNVRRLFQDGSTAKVN